MTAERSSHLPEILRKHETGLLADWIRQQQAVSGQRRDLISDREREAQAKEFLEPVPIGDRNRAAPPT